MLLVLLLLLLLLLLFLIAFYLSRVSTHVWLRFLRKVFTMSVSDTRAVIGTSNRHIWVYDMRTLVEPEQRRVSSLKYQTRCLRVFPDQKGYAVGSVEGRVAVEYFDTSKVGLRLDWVWCRWLVVTVIPCCTVGDVNVAT